MSTLFKCGVVAIWVKLSTMLTFPNGFTHMYTLFVRCMCVYLECTVSICAIISIWVFVVYLIICMCACVHVIKTYIKLMIIESIQTSQTCCNRKYKWGQVQLRWNSFVDEFAHMNTISCDKKVCEVCWWISSMCIALV